MFMIPVRLTCTISSDQSKLDLFGMLDCVSAPFLVSFVIRNVFSKRHYIISMTESSILILRCIDQLVILAQQARARAE